MDISSARKEIDKYSNSPKYESMIGVASIITELVSHKNIQPIIVGGLSVEIYTQSEYATRDIDFVSDGYDYLSTLLVELGFKKEGRHFYHEDVEIVIEIPDNYLAGDYKKVKKVLLDNGKHIFVIGIEDIILDRLRAMIHWESKEDGIWALKLLTANIDTIDIKYLTDHTESKKEKDVLENWIQHLN